MSRATTTAIFTVGFIAWAAGAMAVSVYGFDQYEPAWGRGPSYQVVLWIILVAAIVAAFGFALGFKCSEISLPYWKPFLLSAVFTLLFGALTFLAGYIGRFGVEQDWRLLFLALVTFVCSFAAAKGRRADKQRAIRCDWHGSQQAGGSPAIAL